MNDASHDAQQALRANSVVILIGSANAEVGMSAGWNILSAGGSALDAVEATVRPVEDNPDDHTVGYAGYPNVLGQVELDASIVDGVGRRMGAVGALQGYRAAITVARAVMERTSHVFIVGEGAARLAAEIGLEPENLLTPEVEQVWRRRTQGIQVPDVPQGPLLDAVHLATDPEKVAGTVNVMAIDAAGRIASAVSTSGWAWKYPGRLGDSPVAGAGNYADVRYGAAACTGWGEMTVRAGTARSIVAALAHGVPLDKACADAIRDIGTLAGLEEASMPVNIIAIDAAGNHCAVASEPGRKYIVQQEGMDRPEIRERKFVSFSD